jgi:hypothetical protein
MNHLQTISFAAKERGLSISTKKMSITSKRSTTTTMKQFYGLRGCDMKHRKKILDVDKASVRRHSYGEDMYIHPKKKTLCMYIVKM